MLPVRAVTTKVAPVVFRNVQNRNVYSRRNTIISTPPRVKISALERFAHSVVMFGAINAYPIYVLRKLKTG